MTTYDGRNPDFGKNQTANKEPVFVNRHIYQKQVIKRHAVHMDRINFAKAKTETQFDWSACKFMEDRISMNYQAKIKSIAITKDNMIMLDRISRIRMTDGPIAHSKPHDTPRRHMKRLKALNRKKEQERIENENKILFSRFKKTQPYYTSDGFDKAQESHDKWLELRKVDNTAGHIMSKKNIIKSSTLPKLIEYEQLYTSSIRSPLAESIAAAMDTDGCSTELEMVSIDGSVCVQTNRPTSRHSSRQNSRSGSRSASRPGSENKDRVAKDQSSGSLQSNADAMLLDENSQIEFLDYGSEDSSLNGKTVGTKRVEKVLCESTIPVLSSNCQLRALLICDNQFQENIVLQLWDSGLKCLLSDRVITIDEVASILDSGSGKESDEQNTVRTMLSNMFEEADSDKSGYLTYDELSNLMAQIHVGILPHELRLVMSEADEDDNGLIDYHEFVPLAVDLIQSFRCRQEGLDSFESDQAALEMEANLALNKDELKMTCDKILSKCREADKNDIGSLGAIDFKQMLRDPSISLSPVEINLVCQTMPRNAVRRIIYSHVSESVLRVRMDSVKNAIMEARGTELHRYLMGIFKKEEKKTNEAGDSKNKTSGQLSVRAFLRALISAARLSLSRVQAMVIVSGCKISGGVINYYQLVPSIAKMIERMFDGKVLRERAQMIESADFAPEMLLRGTDPETLLKRLKTLFKSLDTDRSGELDPDEFKGLLDSLDMKLTEPEILALMAGADVDGNGKISFDEFAVFCSHNLLELEKEKHIKAIQAKLCPVADNDEASVESSSVETLSAESSKSSVTRDRVLHKRSSDVSADRFDEQDKEITDTEENLLSIFHCEDDDETGLISAEFVVSVVGKLFSDMSEDEMILLTQEFILNGEGRVIYQDCVCQIATLLIKITSAIPRFAISNDLDQFQSVQHDFLATASDLCVNLKSMLLEDNSTAITARSFFAAAKSASSDKVVKMVMSNRGCLSNRQKTAIIVRVLTYTSNKLRRQQSVIGSSAEAWESSLQSFISRLKSIELSRYHFMSRGEKALNTIIRESLEQSKDNQSMNGTTPSIVKKRQASFDEASLEQATVDPSRSCVTITSALHALSNTNELQLSPNQILGILAWCDGIDPHSGRVDTVRFSFYSARLIERMYDTTDIALGQAVMEVSNGLEVDDIMNGLTEQMLQEHIESGKISLGSISDFISLEDTSVLLQSIPCIQLTNREIQCILALYARQTEHNVCFSELSKVLFGSIYQMRLFVMIQRRIPLYKIWYHATKNSSDHDSNSHDSNSEALDAYKKRLQEANRLTSRHIAKLLKRMIIRVTRGQQYRILLPTEAALENRKSAAGRNYSSVEESSSESEAAADQEAARRMDFKEMCRFGVSSGSTLLLVTIYESEHDQMAINSPFEMDVFNVKTCKLFRMKLDTYIPSIIRADHDSAVEFVKRATREVVLSHYFSQLN